MPLYEYKCHGCGKTFEVIQKFADAPLETHPECGGKTERLLSPPALQFKGSGWYVTDYARKNGAARGEAGKSDGEKSGAQKSEQKSSENKTSSDKSGDAKPASSSESKSKPSSNPSSAS